MGFFSNLFSNEFETQAKKILAEVPEEKEINQRAITFALSAIKAELNKLDQQFYNDYLAESREVDNIVGKWLDEGDDASKGLKRLKNDLVDALKEGNPYNEADLLKQAIALRKKSAVSDAVVEYIMNHMNDLQKNGYGEIKKNPEVRTEEELQEYLRVKVTGSSSKRKKKEPIVQQLSAADEILKFKQLLDMGVITQEEFDKKKKQLLDL